MTAHVIIPNSTLQPGQFATSAIAFAFRDNMVALAEGDSTSLSAVGGIAIALNGKTAIRTDETNTKKVLRPDGSNSVEWVTPTNIVDAFSYHAIDIKDSAQTLAKGDTTGSVGYDWGLKASGGTARISGLIQDLQTIQVNGSAHQCNAYVAATSGASPNPVLLVNIYKAVYVSGADTLDFSVTIARQTSIGGPNNGSWLSASIAADDAWHNLLFAEDNTNLQEGKVQVKTDGNTVAFRTQIKAVSNSYAGFNLFVQIER